MEKEQKGKSSNTGLKMLLAGVAGVAVGFFANKFLGEEKKEQVKEEKNESNQNQNNQQAYAQNQYNALNCDQQAQLNQQNTQLDTQCDDIYCPITLEVMQDPVISHKCGHSFEQAAIIDWLKKNEKCPTCNTTISSDQLSKNYGLKNTIDFMQKQQTAALSQAQTN